LYCLWLIKYYYYIYIHKPKLKNKPTNLQKSVRNESNEKLKTTEVNKPLGKTKGQSKMDNPKKLATLSTQDIGL
jgi:CO dehydrogenase/acetyl-CoA synthase alpha subunit